MSVDSAFRASVGAVPHLDAPPHYTKTDPSPGGVPRIVLPSGHVAAHLTRYRDVFAVLADPTCSRSVTNVEDGPSFLPTIMPKEMLLNLDVPDHSRMKTVANAEYSARAVAALTPVLGTVVDERFAALRAEERPDLFRTVLDEVPIRVNSVFLGLPLADREYYRPLGHTVQRAPADDVEGLLADFWRLYEYVTDLVRGVRPVREGGLIARLLAGRSASTPPLTDEELVALLLGSVLGADQNILSVLTKAVYVLLVSPGLWGRLHDEPALVTPVCEELIRLIPLGTISAFPRVLTRDVETSEGIVPEGSVVYADAFAANRDPEAFPDPLTIDPGRRGPRHLQFGYGMHHCMGAALARLEITTLVGRLVAEFPGMTLDADPHTLPWDTGTVLRRPAALPVRW
ncbi:cytochrome P450 [Amycolatopsis sp. NBC_01307]|uniref:cytochrome P450 n=1 Tax=Amycolatopsis sp. NBC_01307 TaxID=2903561 RepID=UPI002E0E07F1|nr:cytochrome P450 [Amycolatopsis sp. NBC_01307]